MTGACACVSWRAGSGRLLTLYAGRRRYVVVHAHTRTLDLEFTSTEECQWFYRGLDNLIHFVRAHPHRRVEQEAASLSAAASDGPRTMRDAAFSQVEYVTPTRRPHDPHGAYQSPARVTPSRSAENAPRSGGHDSSHGYRGASPRRRGSQDRTPGASRRRAERRASSERRGASVHSRKPQTPTTPRSTSSSRLLIAKDSFLRKIGFKRG